MQEYTPRPKHKIDKLLLMSISALLILGLLMVTSSSMVISERNFNTPFHFLLRQLMCLGIGGVGLLFMLKIPMKAWAKFSPIVLLFGFVLLLLVLIPGFGKSINGSARWLGVGAFGIQVSEVIKLFFLLYLAGYIVRHKTAVANTFVGFIKPLIVLGFYAVLLLLEPDFGATVVLLLTGLGVLFLAGVRLRYFLMIVVLSGFLMGLLAVISPYRMQRLTTFLDPWQHQYDSGYQLTQSLIAFGRGGLTGVGLGGSIQKLFYLPEAQTDFLFAVLAEELGLAGIIVVVFLFSLLVFRGFVIGKKALAQAQPYNAFLAFGLSLWIGLQAIINMGVNIGILPTKGLTLPLMSYGGSSLMIMCFVIGLLFRIDYEQQRGY